MQLLSDISITFRQPVKKSGVTHQWVPTHSLETIFLNPKPQNTWAAIHEHSHKHTSRTCVSYHISCLLEAHPIILQGDEMAKDAGKPRLWQQAKKEKRIWVKAVLKCTQATSNYCLSHAQSRSFVRLTNDTGFAQNLEKSEWMRWCWLSGDIYSLLMYVCITRESVWFTQKCNTM